MDKRKKSRNFFQGGWEIVAFSSYKHKKAVALGPFGPSGNSFFVLRGQCFGIVIVYEKSYLQIPDMPARTRVRAVRARANQSLSSIGHLVKDDASYAPHFPVQRLP